jgi:kinesin family protein 6/9
MSENTAIEVFLRLRPTKRGIREYQINNDEKEISFQNIKLNKTEDLINNNQTEFNFKFNEIFDFNTKQEEVFEKIGKGVIDQCLEGINGTIFAYGQSGSGKTFTITGGSERYNDRGSTFFSRLFPRTHSSFDFVFVQVYQGGSRSKIYLVHVLYGDLQ